MDKKFPSGFNQLIREPGVKAAFVSEIVSPHPNDCTNCGGVGFMYIFIAKGGPFNSPAGGKYITHWDDGKWWSGQTFAFICPVCKNVS